MLIEIIKNKFGTASLVLALLTVGGVLGLPQTTLGQLPILKGRDTCASDKKICENAANFDYRTCLGYNSKEKCDREKQEDLDNCKDDYDECKKKSKNLSMNKITGDFFPDAYARSLNESNNDEFELISMVIFNSQDANKADTPLFRKNYFRKTVPGTATRNERIYKNSRSFSLFPCHSD